MKTNETRFRMKLTGYQVRTAIGILNQKRLELKEAGHHLLISIYFYNVQYLMNFHSYPLEILFCVVYNIFTYNVSKK